MTKLEAPKGKFRVIAEDIIDNVSWVYRDCDDKMSAVKHAAQKRSKRIKTSVYNDQGQEII